MKITRFRRFLADHQKLFASMSFVFALIAVVLSTAGCGPLTWLSDALQILPIAGSMLSGVLTLIGALTGSTLETAIAAAVSSVIQKAIAGITDLQTIVNEYKANPSTTLLASIEEGTQAVIDNITQLLSDTGITDAATQKKVTDILNLFLSDVKAFASMLPGLKASAGQQLTITVPMTSKQSKEAYNLILTTPTGSPSVDAALAKLHRL